MTATIQQQASTKRHPTAQPHAPRATHRGLSKLRQRLARRHVRAQRLDVQALLVVDGAVHVADGGDLGGQAAEQMNIKKYI